MKRNQLEMLITLEKCTTMKEAANILNKNPSTIGRSLKSLEKELQCCLFQYSKKQLALSPEGKLILEYAHTFTKVIEEMNHFLFPASSQPAYHNWSEQQIEHLLMIRKKKNLSSAAEVLFVSQPSLSQMLNTLNAYCSFPIFETVRGGLHLTLQGETLFIYIEKMHSIFRSIHQDLEEFQNLRVGTVKIGIPMSLGSHLIPLIVPAFLKRFPGIKLRILEADSQKLKNMLKEKQVDFCILHENTDKAMSGKESRIHNYNNDDIRYQICYDESFYLVIPRKWRERLLLPEDRPLEAQDLLRLSNVPFVLIAKRQPPRNVIQRIFENVHLQTGVAFNPIACCSAENVETIKRLVLAETGITFLPEAYIHLNSEQTDLLSYPLADSLEGKWTIAIALPLETSMSRSSKEFIEVMKENLPIVSDSLI